MTFEEWQGRYDPIKNMIADGESAFDGVMFETFGPEVDFVRAHRDSRVWTLVETENGNAIINGFHYVNRIGYFVTRNPYIETAPVEVVLAD
jgi:hypothetical protein